MNASVGWLLACLTSVAATTVAGLPRADFPRLESQDRGSTSYWAVLDSLGQCEKTTLIREYVLDNGDVGRTYASSEPLERAVNTDTDFYVKKLEARGWEPIEQHAAVTGYAKGPLVFCMFRAGPDDPGVPPEAKRLLKQRPIPDDSKFFFDVQVGAKHDTPRAPQGQSSHPVEEAGCLTTARLDQQRAELEATTIAAAAPRAWCFR
jgi:hypothetical protein